MYKNSDELKSAVFDSMSTWSLGQISASLKNGVAAFEGPESGASRHFQIDVLPHVISTEEFRVLEQGAAQWGDFLTFVYSDLHTSQTLLNNNSLNPSDIWKPEVFHPEFHNLAPAGYPPISMLQLDVIRSEEGFRLINVDASPLSLLGRVVECRIHQSRVFGQRVPRQQVRRIAPYFIDLKDFWRSISPRKVEEPGIMLWSPGQADPDYPIHSFLARYFGIPLVESRDLTFRSGKIYLKLLEGLRQADVLVRFVADADLDPLGKVSRDARGVAGLIESMRTGHVAVCNAPGTDLFSAPGLLASLAHVAASRMPQGGLIPYAPQVSAALSDSLRRDNAWVKSPLVLSLFAQQLGTGWKLMGGGIASVIEGDQPMRVESASRIHKDIWVMSADDVENTSLLSSLEKPSDIRRASDIPSRVAEDLFWLGRHSERIWLDIQFLEKWLAMESELPTGGSGGGNFPRADVNAFSRIISALNIAPEDFETDGDYSRWNLFQSIENFCMNALRVNERFSLDAQRMIGRFSADFRSRQADQPRETLDEISLLISAFNGVVMENMTRTSAWRFLEIGRRLERALLLSEALTHLFDASVRHPRLLSLVLEIFDSLMTYRVRYQLQPQIEGVADLLVLDETNPRSLAFQLEALRHQIESLPGIRDGAYRSRPERIIIDLQSSLRIHEGVGLPLRHDKASNAAIAAQPGQAQLSPQMDGTSAYLQDVLDAMAGGLLSLSSAVSERYFTKTETSQFIRSHRKG